MNASQLSSKYTVRKLRDGDVEAVFELYQGNPLFFRFCPPPPTLKGVLEDMKALPPQVSPDQKYYIGFFTGTTLVAVMDLILDYPNEATAFIGLFMMCQDAQGKGSGSDLIEECAMILKRQGYQTIQLAYAKGNPQSERFWLKNGFIPVGKETVLEEYTAVLMERAVN